jgi:hypothetical protein
MVLHAPEFTHPLYAVYSDAAESDVLGTALEGLRQVAEAEGPLAIDGCEPTKPDASTMHLIAEAHALTAETPREVARVAKLRKEFVTPASELAMGVQNAG